MKDTAKRYVSVARAIEMLLVSERSIRRWIAHDPPLLHAIKDPSGHTLVDLDDILAIQAQKPELKNPLPDRVEALEEQVQEVLALKPDVQTLEREVEVLKQQVGNLLALFEVGVTPEMAFMPRKRTSVARQSGAEARGYPAGTMRLVEFAEKHQLTISEIKELHWQGAFTVTIYERPQAKRNGREWWITPEQHRAVASYYQQRGLSCVPCDYCSIVPLALSN